MTNAGATLSYGVAAAASTPFVVVSRPGKATFEAQLDLVAGYADLREDRSAEILSQLVPQFAFWSSVVNLLPARTKWTMELMELALRLANFVEMRFKFALAVRRPHELSAQIQPMIPCPGHGSFPSGHSTEAHTVAYLLSELIPPQTTATQLREQLMRQAARIAINRTVAGVHYPADSSAGQFIGLLLGQYLVARCKGGTTFDGYRL